MDDARDHTTGVEMARDLDDFLMDTDGDLGRFFYAILDAEAVKAVLAEYQEAHKRWHEERGHDRTWFEMNNMKTYEFARATAAVVAAHLGW